MACRQALRQKAAMWTTPGEQPPLFYFMRKDLTDYLTKASAALVYHHTRTSKNAGMPSEQRLCMPTL